MLRHHRAEGADPSSPTYERHEPAGIPNRHGLTRPTRRSGGKHTATHLLLARRRRVASGHDLGAGSEVGAVTGDKEGPEEQERGAKGPRVEREVPRRLLLLLLPRLVHNLRRQRTLKLSPHELTTARSTQSRVLCNRLPSA